MPVCDLSPSEQAGDNSDITREWSAVVVVQGGEGGGRNVWQGSLGAAQALSHQGQHPNPGLGNTRVPTGQVLSQGAGLPSAGMGGLFTPLEQGIRCTLCPQHAESGHGRPGLPTGVSDMVCLLPAWEAFPPLPGRPGLLTKTIRVVLFHWQLGRQREVIPHF